MGIDYEDLGRQIKKQRVRAGLSQAELAARADISVQHICNVENAHTKIGLNKLVCVANAMGITVDQLLCSSLKENRAIYSNEIAIIIEKYSESELRTLPEYLRYFGYISELIQKTLDD